MKGGVVTAGNSSQQNDAAAACLIVAEDKLASLELEPMGVLVGWAAAGCHPATMGLGPVPAVEKLFARLKLSWKDIDLVELNEAFARAGAGRAQGLGLGRSRQAQRQRLRHFARPSDRRDGRAHSGDAAARDEAAQGALGLETMCVGGGQGVAAVFERVG